MPTLVSCPINDRFLHPAALPLDIKLLVRLLFTRALDAVFGLEFLRTVVYSSIFGMASEYVPSAILPSLKKPDESQSEAAFIIEGVVSSRGFGRSEAAD